MTLSLIGDRDSHSVQAEWDFVDESTAAMLGVQLVYEAYCCPRSSASSWWKDPRIRDPDTVEDVLYEPLENGSCQGMFSAAFRENPCRMDSLAGPSTDEVAGSSLATARTILAHATARDEAVRNTSERAMYRVSFSDFVDECDLRPPPSFNLQRCVQASLDAHSQRTRPVACSARVPLGNLAMCNTVSVRSRPQAVLAHVQPAWACPAPCSQLFASPSAVLQAPTESKVGSLSSLAPWDIPVLPEDLNHRDVRGQCVTSFPWFAGFRATGGVTSTSQQYRYALFSIEGQAEVRELGPGWSLTDVIQDVLRVVPNLRNIRVLLCRLAGFPALQISATSSSVPLPGHAYPLDLRSVGGRVCTVALFPGTTAGEVTARITGECQAFRRPGCAFSLSLPDGRPFRAIPFQVLGPDFIKGETAGTLEAASDSAPSPYAQGARWGFDTVEFDDADFLQLSTRPASATGAKPASLQPYFEDAAFASGLCFSIGDVVDFACMQSHCKVAACSPVPPLFGSSDVGRPAGPAAKPPATKAAPCLLSDLRAAISAQIPLRPSWMAGQQYSPPMDYACVASPPPVESSRGGFTRFSNLG